MITDDEMENLMNDDRPEDQPDKITLDINDEGNNQVYLNNEPVCGSCKVNYINKGTQHPIGHGTDCPTCRAIDIEYSLQDADDCWC